MKSYMKYTIKHTQKDNKNIDKLEFKKKKKNKLKTLKHQTSQRAQIHYIKISNVTVQKNRQVMLKLTIGLFSLCFSLGVPVEYQSVPYLIMFAKPKSIAYNNRGDLICFRVYRMLLPPGE